MIRIAICDDEDGFLFIEDKLIRQYMDNHAYQYHVDTFSSGFDFLKLNTEINNYDIIFLDINMARLDGMETAKRIREYGSEAYIVFVTAFVTYALEGYKVDAFRYLLKERDSLELSIVECLDSIILKMNYSENRENFEFVEGNKTLSPDDIIYIESNLHKLTFYLAKDNIEKYTMYEKLDVIDSKLQSYGFCRIHKSYLVNLKYVHEIERYTVKLAKDVFGESTLRVSQARYNAAREQFIFYQGEI